MRRSIDDYPFEPADLPADADELDANPRARSAKLRAAVRTDAPARREEKAAGMEQFFRQMFLGAYALQEHTK